MAHSPINRKQELAVSALLECRTLEEAAERVQVSVRTLRTWQALPGFGQAFRAARLQMVEASIARVQGLLGEAVDTRRRLLTCGHAPTERAAAEGLMAYATRGVELTDMVERLELIEETLKERTS
jgi:hypothetical protein